MCMSCRAITYFEDGLRCGDFKAVCSNRQGNPISTYCIICNERFCFSCDLTGTRP